MSTPDGAEVLLELATVGVKVIVSFPEIEEVGALVLLGEGLFGAVWSTVGTGVKGPDVSLKPVGAMVII